MGCSSSVTTSAAGGATEDAPAGAAVINELTAQIQGADLAQYDAETMLMAKAARTIYDVSSGPSILAASEMDNTYWTTEDTIPNMYCGDTCGGEGNFSSPREYMDDQLNPNFVNLPGNGQTEGAATGLMGRLVSTMKFACALGYFLEGDDLPDPIAATTRTMTNADMVAPNQYCGSNLQLPGALDVTFEVTEVTGTFSRHIHITSAAFENHIWMYNDGTTKRVLSGESDTDDYVQGSRYYLQYDETSQIGRFEGFERGFVDTDGEIGGYYFYRAMVDDNTKNVEVVGQAGGVERISGVTHIRNGVLFLGKGNMDETNATWVVAELEADGAYFNDHPKTGCINMSNGAFVSGGSCGDFPILEATIDSARDLINTDVLAIDSYNDWVRDQTIATLEFTESTIYTAPPTQGAAL